MSDKKYIVGIDGDAVLDYGALEYIVETWTPRRASSSART